MDPADVYPSGSVTLRSLFPDSRFVAASDIFVTAITDRAEDIQTGMTFAAVRGTRHDGADFLDTALARGAGSLLLDRPRPELPIPQCIVPAVRAAYSRVCAALAGPAAADVKVVGVTGTNGKSTTTWMVRSILQSAGRRCGVLGTIEYHDGMHGEPATLTTPDPRTLWQWLARMGAAETRYAAIELSSHALHQRRADGVSLAAAIVTNVTHEHLDYHGTFEAYRESKARIFDLLHPAGTAIVNLDDSMGRRMTSQIPSGSLWLSVSMRDAADLSASKVELSLRGTTFCLETPWGCRWCRLPIAGEHNVMNALEAAAAVLSLGVTLDDVVQGLETFAGVPGRLERIDIGQPFTVLVDYAHTDDALDRCLRTLRPLTSGRLICVFGAGGDRDRSKRPKMGAAALGADVAIITSDNPRSEDPQQIALQITAGMAGGRDRAIVELDREQAIRRAIIQAQPGDCVVIAGKGHEQEQIIGRTRRPFDDRLVAQQCLQDIWMNSNAFPQRISA